MLFQAYIAFANRDQISRYRFLLLDNHGSHLTYDFLQYCQEHDIIVFTFPPHTTHLLQPLDGKPFQQLKHYHGKTVNNAARLGYDKFDKRDFLEALPGIRNNAFKPHTIKSGFSDRGIHPYNPDPIVKGLEDQAEPIPDIKIWTGDHDAQGNALSSPISSQTSSPKNLKRLKKNINIAQSALDETSSILDSTSPGLNDRINKIFNGSLMQAELNAHREEEMEQYLQAAKRRKQPKSRRQVQESLSSNGSMTVRDARRRIDERRSKEIQRQWRSRPIGVDSDPDSTPQNKNQRERSIEAESSLARLPNEALFYVDTGGSGSAR